MKHVMYFLVFITIVIMFYKLFYVDVASTGFKINLNKPRIIDLRDSNVPSDTFSNRMNDKNDIKADTDHFKKVSTNLRFSHSRIKTKTTASNTVKSIRERVKTTKLNKYINIVTANRTKHDFKKSSLLTVHRPLIIYIHDVIDTISMNIHMRGKWEDELVSQFSDYIQRHPGIQVLDIGCNVGLYTLTAAAIGSSVVCIDANRNNTDRVAQSVLDNGFEDKVIIVLNAVTNIRGEFSMKYIMNDIGAQVISENSVDPYRVQGIFIDDLVPLFDRNREVFIKIDIEGQELAAFEGASEFFDAINIKVVIMEWQFVHQWDGGNFIVNFLRTRHFKPYKYINISTPLSKISLDKWPPDIVWIKL